jgi:hypothetical protein
VLGGAVGQHGASCPSMIATIVSDARIMILDHPRIMILDHPRIMILDHPRIIILDHSSSASCNPPSGDAGRALDVFGPEGRQIV